MERRNIICLFFVSEAALTTIGGLIILTIMAAAGFVSGYITTIMIILFAVYCLVISAVALGLWLEMGDHLLVFIVISAIIMFAAGFDWFRNEFFSYMKFYSKSLFPVK